MLTLGTLLALPLTAVAGPEDPKEGSDWGEDAEPAPAKVTAKPAKVTAAPASGGVMHATGGNIGLFFSFGGLASLAVGTVDRRSDDKNLGEVVTALGLRLVLTDALQIPIGFGLAIGHDDIDGDGETNDFGISINVGAEYHFRVWQRISPYIGGKLHLDYLNPTGDNTWQIGMGLGPVLGVEVYIVDRISISAEYSLMINNMFRDAENEVGKDVIETNHTTKTGVSNGGTIFINIYF